MESGRFSSTLTVLFSRRMLVALVMGFSCGLPLLLTISVLQAWMKEEGLDLSVIGMMALVGLPYTVKFLWAPFFDRYVPRFLGRRRGWLIIAQCALMAAIAALGLTSPQHNPWMVAFVAFLVTFFSASQDIIVDAYRREDLAEKELGLGSSLYVNGYRTGMLLASGGGLILSDHIPFSTVYLIMALCMLPGIVTTLLTPEPEMVGAPKTFREAVAG
ncbi:MAG: MFS transporter, partial [Thermodesulfobacteriota bacterium]